MSFSAFENLTDEEIIEIFFEQISKEYSYEAYQEIINSVYDGGSQIFEYNEEQYIYNYRFIHKIKKVILSKIIEENSKTLELIVLLSPSGFYEIVENGITLQAQYKTLEDVKMNYKGLL